MHFIKCFGATFTILIIILHILGNIYLIRCCIVFTSIAPDPGGIDRACKWKWELTYFFWIRKGTKKQDELFCFIEKQCVVEGHCEGAH
jgi:hypothetical protein